MPPREWRLRIADILTAVMRIREYTSDKTFETFVADSMAFDAVLHNLVIIGEAARHVPNHIAAKYPDLPLADMRAMRNVVIHEYPGVRATTVWATIQHDLPPLEPVLERILQENT